MTELFHPVQKMTRINRKIPKEQENNFFIITDMVVCHQLARPLSARTPVYAP